LQRRALLQAGMRVLPATTNAEMAADRDSAAQLCRSGFRLLNASPAGLRSLRVAVQPVYAALGRSAVTREYLDRIRALGSADAAPQKLNCSSGTTPQPAGAASPLDGVYRMTVSQAAAARYGHVPASRAIPENYGDFVLVIDRGRFAFTQANAKACTWQYGTLSLKADRMNWLFTDGGGIAPTNSQIKPGERLVFKSTLYRGTLKLTAIAPADLGRQIWRQVSTAPRAAALNQRCRPPAAALTP
jgi:hypothetical protein